MTHTPPIPAGNQSPYPIVEPPHQPAAAKLPPVAKSDDGPADGRRGGLPLLAIGVAVGLGVAALGGVLLNARRGGAKPVKKRSARKKP